MTEKPGIARYFRRLGEDAHLCEAIYDRIYEEGIERRRRDRPCIDLFALRIPLLLLPWKSGVLYSTQTGGTSCFHPEMEGVIVPLSEQYSEPLATLLDAHEYCCSFLTEEDADIFDRIFTTCTLPLKTNRAKLAEGEEAWLPVLIAEHAKDLVPHEFYGKEARLIWNNCD